VIFPLTSVGKDGYGAAPAPILVLPGFPGSVKKFWGASAGTFIQKSFSCLGCFSRTGSMNKKVSHGFGGLGSELISHSASNSVSSNQFAILTDNWRKPSDFSARFFHPATAFGLRASKSRPAKSRRALSAT
jgi:hypothetical protein